MIFQKWKDEFLTRKPKKHYNQSRIILSSKDIWTPGFLKINYMNYIKYILNFII